MTNITDIRFQGDNLPVDQPAQIIFLPTANLTFTTSYNIIFSNLSFTISGLQSGTDKFFGSVKFPSSSYSLVKLDCCKQQ